LAFLPRFFGNLIQY